MRDVLPRGGANVPFDQKSDRTQVEEGLCLDRSARRWREARPGSRCRGFDRGYAAFPVLEMMTVGPSHERLDLTIKATRRRSPQRWDRGRMALRDEKNSQSAWKSAIKRK
jgi:hypothetical protein